MKAAGVLSGILLSASIRVEAAPLAGNPNITWSPDGQAFTTDAGEQGRASYGRGYTVTTGAVAGKRELGTGQHYYESNRTGEIPIKKWVVSYEPGRCIHNGYPDENEDYHGINYSTQICKETYKSGWMGICADCNQEIFMLFYMDKETAESLRYLPAGYDYYYLCPWCNNLEQGASIHHTCKNEISWNKYSIKYKGNDGVGYMENSTFMYNNATTYEGKAITPETKLRKNTFYREGFEFVGWNTKPDGSGRSFTDGQEILNLTAVNKAAITLFAQWKKSESTLHIDPAGGTFAGREGVTSVKQGYGTMFQVLAEDVTPPQGNKIQFVTDGGTPVPDMFTAKYFLYWQQSNPFYGRIEEDSYTFLGANGAEDTLTACYGSKPIVLPTTDKPGFSFGGWYQDPECTIPVGTAGEEITVTEDTILYAKWVNLQLTSVDNYTAFGGSGAVDLSWIQADSNPKTYRLYQSRDAVNWQPITYAGTAEAVEVSESFAATKTQETYTVTYSGLYTLTAVGAQGGGYESYMGGKGGKVSASVWLAKGETLTYCIGTTDGYNGGGYGSAYGTGGGMTSISSDKKGLLLAAGGGGGASPAGSGGAGGTSVSLRADKKGNGAAGQAGGGAGYVGGNAGSYIKHVHTEACGYHAHAGNATIGGACYATPIIQKTEKTCNVDIGGFADTRSWLHEAGCGGTVTLDTYFIDSQCGGSANSANGGMDHGEGYKQAYCSVCGWLEEYCSNNIGYSHQYYEEETAGYKLTCTLPEGYRCGKTEDTIESSKPAYGGSNYINTAYCAVKEDVPGVGVGNGSFQFYLASADYVDSVSLSDVEAKDLAAPAPVDTGSIVKTSAGGEAVQVLWNVPQDYGTEYFHKAESYHALTGSKLCDSNITANTLTSGIAGYYYRIDGSAGTEADRSDNFTTANSMTIPLTADIQYLHIAAADVAGNLSGTVHIQLGHQDKEVAWKLTTGQVGIQGYDRNIYAAPETKTWYVRADGETPFTMDFTAAMEHAALETYQINHMIFDIVAEEDGSCQRHDAYTPSHPIAAGDIISKVGEVEKSMWGTPILSDAVYTVTTRSNGCRDMEIARNFTLPAAFDSKLLTITPAAGADGQDGVVYSDREEDVLHGIRLIGDGLAPVIHGTEILESLQEIDRDNGSVVVDLTCEDAGSGVREFYMEVTNLDNFITKTFTADADGRLQVDLTAADDFVFNGDFNIAIHAVDNVGNDAELLFSTCEFSLTAYITRMLEPHDPVFRRGETGILHIVTTGYVDRVEVEAVSPFFPTGQAFVYTQRDYLQEEAVEFFIPLDAEEKTYVFRVRAFKDGKQLQAHPKMGVMELSGTVLDDFRRKILWN